MAVRSTTNIRSNKMTKQTQNDDSSLANRMAAALEKAGIKSTKPRPLPNPKEAARKAYIAVFPNDGVRGFNALQRELLKKQIPSEDYCFRMARYCEKALRRASLSPEETEEISYARGFFDGLRKGALNTGSIKI